jgi:hypothetical protein
MPLAFAEVPQERLGGGLADRDSPTGPAFAATDRDQATDDVDVVELEVDHLAGADRGLEHEPDSHTQSTVGSRNASIPPNTWTESGQTPILRQVSK